jgi:hypothetical protein
MRAWVGIGALLALAMVAAGCGDCDNDHDDDGNGGGAAAPTPTVTATAPPQIPCPQRLTYTADGPDDLDAGWTGIYFDQDVGDDGSLSFNLDCPGDFLGTCGVCSLSGPVQSTTVVNNHRCQNALQTTCTTDAECPGSACVFYFGAPIAVSGGGVPVCVLNRVVGSVTGTLSPELGAGASDFDVEWSIFTGLDIDQPCPTCSGAAPGDSGTCNGGSRDGESCRVDGTTDHFGNVSFDCPPNPGAAIGNVGVALDLTTGTRELQPTAECSSGPFAGDACYCEGQAQPNACMDGVCTVDAGGEGACLAGPVDPVCNIEAFRSCDDDGDCPAAGDVCGTRRRECLGATDATGALNGPVTITGTPSTSAPVQVGAFCVGATASGAVNAAAGFPGPGTLRLPTTVCVLPSCP